MKIRMYILLGVAGSCLLTGCGRRVSSVEMDQATSEEKQGQAGADKKNDKPGETKPVAVPGSGPFRFPGDKGGKLLAELLPTPEQISLREKGNSLQPRSFPVLEKLDKPEMPLPVNESGLPRASASPDGKSIKPRSLPDDSPLSREVWDISVPEKAFFPARLGVRLPSLNAELALAVPVLGQEVPDRASLDDPTSEASMVLSLAAVMPQRTKPAPFERVNLPDPFENTQVVKLRELPKEDQAPPGIPPGPPAK